MVFITYFVNAADIGAEWAVMQLRKGLRSLPLAGVSESKSSRASTASSVAVSINVPSVARRTPGLLHKDRQNEPGSDGNNQKIAEQQTHANAHQTLLRLYPIPRCVLMGESSAMARSLARSVLMWVSTVLSKVSASAQTNHQLL